MKIDPKLTLRNVAGENMVLLMGHRPGDQSHILVFNNTSCFLWNEFKDIDFTESDIVRLLLDHFKVSDEQALSDAQQWVSTLRLNNAVLD